MAHENEPQDTHDHDHQGEAARNIWFVPSQLMLLVECPADTDEEAMRGWLRGTLPNISDGSGINPDNPDSEISIFNQREGQSIAFITLDIGHNTSPSVNIDSQVITLINWINSHIRPSDGGDGLRAWSITEGEITASILAAAPNWVFGSATHQQADGGPGGKPVPPKTSPSAPDYEFHLPAAITNLFGAQNEENCKLPVDVVILDAVPPITTINTAKIKYPKDPKPGSTANPLFHNVLTPLNVVRAQTLKTSLPPSPTTAGQPVYTAKLLSDYDMSDHGLFIAGIIHSIALNASLHLYETLNSHGVGSVATLIKGLEYIVNNLLSSNQRGPRALVVNISQCIGFHKLSDLIEGSNSMFALFNALLTDSFDLAQYIDLLLKPLKVAIDAVKHSAPADIEVIIIASAGNDGLPGARYPAAYQNVIAVGALDHLGGKAAYSNIPANGVMVFGGSTLTVSNLTVTDPDHGLLGVYIGNFPNATANQAGFARWAGTSFAAAVMSGIYALQASCNGITAQQANLGHDPAIAKVQSIKAALANSPDGVKQGALS